MGIFSEVMEKSGKVKELKFKEQPFYHISNIKQHLLGSLLNVISLQDRPVNLIGIVSSSAGEGCSTITRLCGYSFCYEENASTLVVDANTLSPSLHLVEKIPQMPGFSDLVLKNISLEEVVVRKNEIPVGFITSGTPVDNLSRLYSHPKVDEVLQNIRKVFKYAFFDLPPINSEPESILIAKKLDGVVFVVRAHSTRFKSAEIAIGKLKTAKVSILGGILNGKKFFIPRFIYERL